MYRTTADWAAAPRLLPHTSPTMTMSRPGAERDEVVEVAAHARGLGGGAVPHPDVDAGDRRRLHQQRLLEGLGDGVLALVRRRVVQAGAELGAERGQQQPVLLVEVAAVLVGDHEGGGLQRHVALERREQQAVALRDDRSDELAAGEVLVERRRHGDAAALQQLGLDGRQLQRARAAGHGQRLRRQVLAGAAEHGGGAHVHEVERRRRDLVEHVLQLRPLEAPVQVDGERLQALQAARQPVAALRRDALALEQPRLVHGQRGEAADGPRELDLLRRRSCRDSTS